MYVLKNICENETSLLPGLTSNIYPNYIVVGFEHHGLNMFHVIGYQD